MKIYSDLFSRKVVEWAEKESHNFPQEEGNYGNILDFGLEVKNDDGTVLGTVPFPEEVIKTPIPSWVDVWSVDNQSSVVGLIIFKSESPSYREEARKILEFFE